MLCYELSYLGSKKLVRSVIKQHRNHILVSFLAGDVDSRVEVLGGGVRRCSVLQQQDHVVGVAKSSCDVQRRLLLLE